MTTLNYKDILDRIDRKIRNMEFSSNKEFDIELLDAVDVRIRYYKNELLDTDPQLIEKLYFKYLT